MDASCGFTPLQIWNKVYGSPRRGIHNDRGTGPRAVGEKLYLVTDDHQYTVMIQPLTQYQNVRVI